MEQVKLLSFKNQTYNETTSSTFSQINKVYIDLTYESSFKNKEQKSC